MYRRLLKSAKSLPLDKRHESVNQIRIAFRDSSGETDPEKIRKLLEHAQSSLGYLKIVTPKRAGGTQTGVTKIVFGNKSAPQGKAVSNWTGSNMDPDSVRRHYQTLKRAGFRDNNHAKGGFF